MEKPPSSIPSHGRTEALPFRSSHATQQNISSRLDSLLPGGRIALQYQPQFDLTTGEVRGVEALLRARNLAGEPLNATDLIASAERNGSIIALGSLILNKACTDFSAMRAVGANLGRLAINVSPLELQQENYAALVIDAIISAGLDFNDVELEITEGWSLSDPRLRLEQLSTLANLGISIALDDFGSAHANWVNVLRLPIRALKIDRALIADLGRCSRTLGAVRSICRACTEMGLEIIAEGVCNAKQRALLLGMKCNHAQGFGLALPMPADKAMDITPLTFDCSPGRSALLAKS